MKAMTTDWSRLVRPSLVGIEPYRPGASVRELRTAYGLESLAQLNWNEHLFDAYPGALEAAAAELENAWAYPDQSYSDFRDAVAHWLGVLPERIVPAHGVQALIAMVAGAFLDAGDAVVVPRPTYGLYAQVSAGRGASVHRVPLSEFRIDLPALADTARSTGARLVWICDPNNPTGLLVDEGEWRAFLDDLPEGCAVVVDEAYREYAAPELRVRRERDVEEGRPVILLRSFSKLFGLAGLRLAYAVVHESLVPFLDVVQEPFNVNRAALAAGRACLERPEHVETRRLEAAAARELLTSLLVEAGFEPLPSQASFVLVHVGVDDVAVAEALARRGLLVRAGGELGLEGYVRITVGPEELMRRVVRELASARRALAG
jgi:histidinol-phosphate aminotransferase